MRSLALGRIVDQALLEDEGVGGVDDDQPLDPVGAGQRRRPRHRPAPIVAGESEFVEAERVGERHHVGHDPVRLVILDALGLVGSGEAALVRSVNPVKIG